MVAGMVEVEEMKDGEEPTQEGGATITGRRKSSRLIELKEKQGIIMEEEKTDELTNKNIGGKKHETSLKLNHLSKALEVGKPSSCKKISVFFSFYGLRIYCCFFFSKIIKPWLSSSDCFF